MFKSDPQILNTLCFTFMHTSLHTFQVARLHNVAMHSLLEVCNNNIIAYIAIYAQILLSAVKASCHRVSLEGGTPTFLLKQSVS